MLPSSQTSARDLRIGMAAINDVQEIQSWSGTPYHMYNALARQGFQMENLSPLRAPLLGTFKILAKLRRLTSMPESSPFHAGPVVRQYADDLKKMSNFSGQHVIFAPAGSPFVWSIPTGPLVVYTSDATFRLISKYDRYSALSKSAYKYIDELERSAIARADLVTYPTEWAARSAVEDYGADPSKICVIPWGANIEDPQHQERRRASVSSKLCRLLLVGADWERKGADVAVDALKHLHALGIDATLKICGCSPPKPITQKGLEVIPFLDKSVPAQRERLQNLYREADFFILPTQAECYGIVFCEAAAYGLPSIAPAVDGVSGAIRDGESGILLPADASGKDFAAAIASAYRDSDRMDHFRETSRLCYETKFNWDIWGKNIASLIVKSASRGT